MSRLRWPDSTNSVSDVPGTIHTALPIFGAERVRAVVNHGYVGSFNFPAGGERVVEGFLLLGDDLKLPVADAFLSQSDRGLIAHDPRLTTVHAQGQNSYDYEQSGEPNDGVKGSVPKYIHPLGLICVVGAIYLDYLGAGIIDRDTRKWRGWGLCGLGTLAFVFGFALLGV